MKRYVAKYILCNPAFPGVTFFILSCIVYGVAFDFFNVSGGLFENRNDVKEEEYIEMIRLKTSVSTYWKMKTYLRKIRKRLQSS